MEARTVATKRGTINTLWVRFVSKATAMALAAKHQLSQRIDVQAQVIDWRLLAAAIPDGPVEDSIELELARLTEQLPQNGLKEWPATETPLNRLENLPSRNGDGHA